MVADIVLAGNDVPRSHDDIYQAGGAQYMRLVSEADRSSGECRPNHDVISALASRVGAEHPGFAMTPRGLST